MKIQIKALSSNECWRGRRFKTEKYLAYEKELLYLLSPLKNIFKEKMEINLKFGFSNMRMDIDNPIKSLLDILQKKYNFNDNLIYKLTVEKFKTNKKEEYIDFEIKDYGR